MRIEYSPSINALYLRLRSGDIAETLELGNDVYADVDDTGEPLGVEFVDAERFFAFLTKHGSAPEGIVAVELPDDLATLVRERTLVATQ